MNVKSIVEERAVELAEYMLPRYVEDLLIEEEN